MIPRLIAFARPLGLALALLTTLPVGRWVASPVSPADPGRSVLWYPVVGLLIGMLLASLAWLLSGVDAPLGAALVVVLWVVLTGALHLDGLADCVDAWFAGHGRDAPERTLAVMKDPAAGPMAVVALLLVLGLKGAAIAAIWSALWSSPASGYWWSPPLVGLLVVVPVLARLAAMLFMATTAYRRAQGLASALDAQLPRAAAWLVAGGGVAFVLVCAGPAAGVIMALGALFVSLGWRALWQRRIGGYTGDVVGGLIELVEVAVLVIAALWATPWV